MRYQTSKPVLAGNENKYVQEALSTGWISGHGPFITRFETEVSGFLNLEEGIAVSSGTAALQLALRCLGVGPGDDVIIPAMTFVACPNSVVYCGANPVFADCDLVSRNLTPECIQEAVTPRTRGVMFVHLFGSPAHVVSVRQLCEEKGLWLLEDCAHSFGARAGDRSAGGFGAASAFSFYGNKVISTGEGGMVFFRDPKKREMACCLREQGMDAGRRHWHIHHGYNARMSNVAAAIGCGQVEMAAFHIAERRRIAQRYRQNLKPLEDDGILRLPVEPAGTMSVYWLYSIVLCGGGWEFRDLIQERTMQQFGIQTRPFYVPMHKLPIYERDLSLPNAEFLGDHGMVLPTYSGLKDEEVDEISLALKQCLTH